MLDLDWPRKKGEPCRVCLVPLLGGGKIGICQRNRECMLAYNVAYDLAYKEERSSYRDGRKEEAATYHAAYYEANKEKHNAQVNAWYEMNKEERTVTINIWKHDNPERRRADSARRRTRAMVNMDEFDRELSVAYRKAIANDPCFYCGAPDENDEHYTPLARGGTDHWWNLVRACAWCNGHKFTMNGDEYLDSLSSPA